MASMFSCIMLLCLHHHLLHFVTGNDHSAASNDYLADVAINCGSNGENGAFDGREWVGDIGLAQSKGSKSSVTADKSFSADPVPYKTSRISTTPFEYKFRVSPGQKFIRLHFHRAPYHGFKYAVDIFTVKAGPFILLHNFSASLAADALGVTFLVKEFCLNIENNAELILTFSPSTTSSSSRKVVAFVNGIEIISMPAGLYYTKDADLGSRNIGPQAGFTSIDNSSALELIERLNIGGGTISSMEDFALFRKWNGDLNHLMVTGVYRVIHPAHRLAYTSLQAYVAPPKLYLTSWQMQPSASVQGMYTLRWKVGVDVGFGYLVRLHFSDFEPRVTDGGKKELTVLMNDQIAETKFDAIDRPCGDCEAPFYRDYMVMMKGKKDGGKCDLMISLSCSDHSEVGLLNGLEIFKLSNLQNSLATPNLVMPRRTELSWKLNIQKLLTLTKTNAITAGVTLILVLVNVIVWNLRKTQEAHKNEDKDTPLLSIDSSFSCFSLNEIQSATKDFSDAAVIGRGGFGKVYKGFITSISQVVAIKRLKADSKQGAREFWTEVETLSKFRHVNLVSLIGYCYESLEMILVYEFMPRGTLADNIYKFAKDGKHSVLLSWEQRLRICIGAARGLEYLHTGAVHRDVKDTNILLDENFVAKVSDFGLSRLERFSESKSYMYTKVWGTPYYIDPEYRRTRKLTRMVDVYAFGVVLLVVLSGRPAEDVINRVTKVEIVDPCLGEGISTSSLKEFVQCVENCLQHQPKKRPTMAQVAASLERALEMQERTTIAVTEDVVESSQIEEDGSAKLMQSPLVEEAFPSPPIQSPALLSKAEETQLREESSSSVRKPVWGWSWIPVRSRGNTKKETDSDSSCESNARHSGPCFSYKELQVAVNFFKGGSLTVDASGREAWSGCMKQLQKQVTIYEDGCLGMDKSKLFPLGMKKLSKLRHVNLHSLIGYCLNVPADRSFVVYEHVGNDSLHGHLYCRGIQDTPLSWKRRLVICMGVAEGLAYVQEWSGVFRNHENLRLGNILLDGNWTPKISHFGLSGFNFLTGRGGYDTHPISSDILPGFRMRLRGDLCSFGLILLEVLLARRINIVDFEGFLMAMKKSIKSRTFHLAIDSSLKGEIATECLAEYMKATKLRTSVASVGSSLKFALALQEKAEASKLLPSYAPT